MALKGYVIAVLWRVYSVHMKRVFLALLKWRSENLTETVCEMKRHTLTVSGREYAPILERLSSSVEKKEYSAKNTQMQ